MGVDARQAGLWPRLVLRVDREDDAPGAEAVGGGADEVRVLDGGGVKRDLVGPGLEHGLDVSQGAQAAPDRERHEALLGGRRHDVAHDPAAVARGRDVEKHQFVGPLGVIGPGAFDRIAGVTQFLELHALDHAASGHVQAWDVAAGEHGSRASLLARPRA